MSVLELTQADNGRSVDVHVNDLIAIRLEENRTTGYMWWGSEKVDERVLVLVRDDFILPKEVKVGGGGIRVLEYKAKIAGATHIELKKRCEWEREDAIIEPFSIAITVSD